MIEKDKNLEELFKESFENFEPEVNPGVWKNIQTGLKSAGIGFLLKGLMNKLGSNALVAVVSSAATVVGTVLVMNFVTSEKPKPAATEVKTRRPPVVKVQEIKDFLAADRKKESPTQVQKVDEEKLPKSNEAPVIKKDKKELQSVINSLSGNSIATISASNVGGAVPLIVSVSNNGNGKNNKWDWGDGKKESANNPVHVYDQPGIYTIILTSTAPDGTIGKDEIKVEVTANSLMMETGDGVSFTPNGDSINDIFIQKGENMQQMSVVIFDGSKNIIKSIFLERDMNAASWSKDNDLVGQWDGKDVKGRPVKEGVYYYILNAIGGDGKKYHQKGKITLTR